MAQTTTPQPSTAPTQPCPPGLEKDNGCMPPGLTRSMGAGGTTEGTGTATGEAAATQGDKEAKDNASATSGKRGKATHAR